MASSDLSRAGPVTRDIEQVGVANIVNLGLVHDFSAKIRFVVLLNF